MAAKGPKITEIRDRSDEELLASRDRARDELFRLKLGRFTNQLTNVMQIRAKRREIARIETTISARRQGLDKAGVAVKEEGKMAAAQNSESTATETEKRGVRRAIVGTVTSDKMDKTVVVTVVRRVRDQRFHKFVTRRVKYKAHDEKNTAKVGDLVEIVEARPMSRTKRWRIIRTISHNAEVAAAEAAADLAAEKAGR